MYSVCSCGRIYHGKKEETMHDMLFRCQSNHVEVEDLVLVPLPINGFTCGTMLFCILEHNRQIGMIRVLKQQLLKIGIAKDNIAVCHRFEITKLKIGNYACQQNQICHYSVRHQWISRVAQWVQKRNATNHNSHVVWLLEVDCQLAELTGSTDKTRKLCRHVDLHMIASEQEITWPGYRKIMAPQVELSALTIVQALRSTYVNPSTERNMPINDNFTKLLYVSSFNFNVQHMLNNAEATPRKFSRTQETRKQMKFHMSALRWQHGIPTFVTFSRVGKHKVLLLRLSHTRWKMSVALKDDSATHITGTQKPTLGKTCDHIDESDHIYLALKLKNLAIIVAHYATGKALIAKDLLCSVNGSLDFNVVLVCTQMMMYNFLKVYVFKPN